MSILFAADLDNTLIYSVSKAAKFASKTCVEYLEGKALSFMSMTSIKHLAAIARMCLFVPITTRSYAQYQRITWPDICKPALALTTNGAILIKDNAIDPEWLAASKSLCAPFKHELSNLFERLQTYELFLKCRFVDDFFIFTYLKPQRSLEPLLNLVKEYSLITLSQSKQKLYFFPNILTKGLALTRLKETFKPEKTFAAGDSTIDLPMLLQAEVAYFCGVDEPIDLAWHITLCKSEPPASDYFLPKIRQQIAELII